MYIFGEFLFRVPHKCHAQMWLGHIAGTVLVFFAKNAVIYQGHYIDIYHVDIVPTH